LVRWAYVNKKCDKCRGKTDRQYELVSITDRSCVSNLTAVEVKVKLEECKKKTPTKDDSVPVPVPVPVPVQTIYKEELSDILEKGYGMVPEIPKCDNVKTRQCKEWRRVLGTEPNPEDCWKI